MSKTAPKVPRLLSKQELAAHLCVSTRTVSRWLKTGELRAYKLGRQVRISELEVIRFISARLK